MSGAGEVFAVEVVETVSTLYRVRARDEQQAREIAVSHNVESGSQGGSVVVCDRDTIVRQPTSGDEGGLTVLDAADYDVVADEASEETSAVVTVGGLADEIDARAAQVACAQIMVMLGDQTDWEIDTIEWVADAVRLVRPSSAPSFTDQDPEAVAFWAAVDTETTDPQTPRPGVAAVLVVVRDPDAATEVNAYTATGERVPLTEVVVDPGAGWSREDWNAARDEAIDSVPAAMRDVVARAYAGQHRSEFITDGDGLGGQE